MTNYSSGIRKTLRELSEDFRNAIEATERLEKKFGKIAEDLDDAREFFKDNFSQPSPPFPYISEKDIQALMDSTKSKP